MNHWLEDVYREHRQGLFSLALSITRSRQQAEDVVHDVLVRLCESEIAIDDPVPYLYRAVRNRAIDASRANGRQQSLATSIFNGSCRSSHGNSNAAEEIALSREREQILRMAIDALPEAQQEAIVLKSFVNLTFEQAGAVLDVSAKTVASRYRRALFKLEEILKGKL